MTRSKAPNMAKIMAEMTAIHAPPLHPPKKLLGQFVKAKKPPKGSVNLPRAKKVVSKIFSISGVSLDHDIKLSQTKTNPKLLTRIHNEWLNHLITQIRTHS